MKSSITVVKDKPELTMLVVKQHYCRSSFEFLCVAPSN